jgi:hypothetical protein
VLERILTELDHTLGRVIRSDASLAAQAVHLSDGC